jgi:cyclophilin family peptidyl-prolyl cis-trans isomerase
MTRFFATLCLLLVATCVAPAQEATDAPPAAPGTAPAQLLTQENQPTAEGATKPSSASSAKSSADYPQMPEEIAKEFDARIAKFNGLRDQLAAALLEQRVILIRYSNSLDKQPADKEAYAQTRNRVRKLMDETYDAALDVIRLAHQEEAATYIITMIQNRVGSDVYDVGTLEGCARMIDGGSTLLYLFQCGARSAVVSGDFELAKRLYKVLNEDEMAEVDKPIFQLLDEHKAMFEAEKAIREQEAKEDKLPRVLLQTTQGDVMLELFINQAPSTVSHFIQLVEDGFYDGLDFHQVIESQLAMTGDKNGDGSGNSGKFLVDENKRPGARKALRGALLMAKIPIGTSGKFVPNSASSQFAITFLPVVSAAEEQTVFGRVIDGLDAITRMRRVDPNKKKEKTDVVLPSDRVIKATVVRRPEILPEPEYFQPPGAQ